MSDIETARGMVQVVIDYSNGVQKSFSGIPWKPEMDILAVMEAAKSIPPGLTFEASSRRDASVGIDVIDGVGGGLGVEWLAWVNSRFVGRRVEPGGVGSEERQQRLRGAPVLKSGDTIFLKLSTEPSRS